jgi:ubiquinone/menaquinone biosynthesis C-methylase UbiE
MLSKIEAGRVADAEVPDRHEIDWDAYASQYDLLAKYNPSYATNIELMRQLLGGIGGFTPASVLDVGAGTGNFLCALGKDYPAARLIHLDSDAVMNAMAKSKYDAAGFDNVEIVTKPALEAGFGDGEFDLVICINALYAMPRREDTLKRILRWLKPGGYFFIIDFGRPTDMLDWSKYIFGHIIRTHGVLEFLRFLVNGRETIRQNRRGAQGQAEGHYWLHSTEEFGRALGRVGFEVEHVEECYRGYCDLALCRRPIC